MQRNYFFAVLNITVNNELVILCRIPVFQHSDCEQWSMCRSIISAAFSFIGFKTLCMLIIVASCLFTFFQFLLRSWFFVLFFNDGYDSTVTIASTFYTPKFWSVERIHWSKSVNFVATTSDTSDKILSNNKWGRPRRSHRVLCDFDFDRSQFVVERGKTKLNFLVLWSLPGNLYFSYWIKHAREA